MESECTKEPIHRAVARGHSNDLSDGLRRYDLRQVTQSKSATIVHLVLPPNVKDFIQRAPRAITHSCAFRRGGARRTKPFTFRRVLTTAASVT